MVCRRGKPGFRIRTSRNWWQRLWVFLLTKTRSLNIHHAPDPASSLAFSIVLRPAPVCLRALPKIPCGKETQPSRRVAEAIILAIIGLDGCVGPHSHTINPG